MLLVCVYVYICMCVHIHSCVRAGVGMPQSMWRPEDDFQDLPPVRLKNIPVPP